MPARLKFAIAVSFTLAMGACSGDRENASDSDQAAPSGSGIYLIEWDSASEEPASPQMRLERLEAYTSANRGCLGQAGVGAMNDVWFFDYVCRGTPEMPADFAAQLTKITPGELCGALRDAGLTDAYPLPRGAEDCFEN